MWKADVKNMDALAGFADKEFASLFHVAQTVRVVVKVVH